MKEDPVVWGIHAGRGGEAHSLFTKGCTLALGWSSVGDLSQIDASRDAFKVKVALVFPEAKSGAVTNYAGVLYRFVHEMKPGDVVVYPAKAERKVYIGEVSGPYEYRPSGDGGFPNRRPVKWLKSLPRSAFKQGALYEIGSALALFQVKNYAEEFLATLSGPPQPSEVDDDETVGLVVEDIERTTDDFILKTLAQDLKGHPLAAFIAHLLNAMGYRTRVSPEGPDGGVDVVAHRDELGFEPPIIKVQVKSTEGSVGDPQVSALYGKVGTQEHGLLITLGTFTNQAKAFAGSKSNLRLIDGEELVDLILAHYEQFDSRYKAILPLRRVYVPAPPNRGQGLACPEEVTNRPSTSECALNQGDCLREQVPATQQPDYDGPTWTADAPSPSPTTAPPARSLRSAPSAPASCPSQVATTAADIGWLAYRRALQK